MWQPDAPGVDRDDTLFAPAPEQARSLLRPPLRTIHTIEAARKIGVPDARVREQLNLMDRIRRARGLPRPILCHHPTDVPDIFIGMALEARVPADAATAFAMNVELAAQMQRQGIDPHPRFAVLFSGSDA